MDLVTFREYTVGLTNVDHIFVHVLHLDENGRGRSDRMFNVVFRTER